MVDMTSRSSIGESQSNKKLNVYCRNGLVVKGRINKRIPKILINYRFSVHQPNDKLTNPSFQV